MNKRDYFAAQAMQALIAKIPLQVADLQDTESVDIIYTMVSNGAYAYADAMLEARKEWN